MSNITSTYDQILDSARILIVAGGYNGFSYADVGKMVGIRNASIHHHFPAKADLVRVLVQQYRHRAAAGIAALERQVPEAPGQLRAYVGYWQTCIADGSQPICIAALLATEAPALPEEVVLEVRAHFRALSNWLTSVMERGAAQGSLRLTQSPHVEAETFMAGVHGAMLSARAYQDPEIFGLITRPLVERLIA